MKSTKSRLGPVLLLVGSSCSASYGEQDVSECLSKQMEPSINVVQKLTNGGSRDVGPVELRHSMCSTHDDRIASTERALLAAGYKHSTGVAELGRCINVVVPSAFNQKAVEQQITSLCTISANNGMVYMNWSGDVGGSFVFVSGDYVAIDPSAK
ncbi:MAG TPA: hypothetical protein VGR19_05830 [Allosphingosinicella sp.]|nr:hypothetical protein [Allosphingosinicella sp.]